MGVDEDERDWVIFGDVVDGEVHRDGGCAVERRGGVDDAVVEADFVIGRVARPAERVSRTEQNVGRREGVDHALRAVLRPEAAERINERDAPVVLEIQLQAIEDIAVDGFGDVRTVRDVRTFEHRVVGVENLVRTGERAGRGLPDVAAARIDAVARGIHRTRAVAQQHVGGVDVLMGQLHRQGVGHGERVLLLCFVEDAVSGCDLREFLEILLVDDAVAVVVHAVRHHIGEGDFVGVGLEPHGVEHLVCHGAGGLAVVTGKFHSGEGLDEARDRCVRHDHRGVDVQLRIAGGCEADALRVFSREDVGFLVAAVIGHDRVVVGASVLHLDVRPRVLESRIVAEVVGATGDGLEQGGTGPEVTLDVVDQIELRDGLEAHHDAVCVGHGRGVDEVRIRGLVDFVALEVELLQHGVEGLLRGAVPVQCDLSVAGHDAQRRFVGGDGEAVVAVVDLLHGFTVLEQVHEIGGETTLSAAVHEGEGETLGRTCEQREVAGTVDEVAILTALRAVVDDGLRHVEETGGHAVPEILVVGQCDVARGSEVLEGRQSDLVRLVHVGLVDVRFAGQSGIEAAEIVAGGRRAVAFAEIVRVVDAVAAEVVEVDVPVAVVVDQVVTPLVDHAVGHAGAGLVIDVAHGTQDVDERVALRVAFQLAVVQEVVLIDDAVEVVVDTVVGVRVDDAVSRSVHDHVALRECGRAGNDLDFHAPGTDGLRS